MSGASVWSSATTLAELCEVNIRFLRGELDESPSHGGLPDSETSEILEPLIQLNERGFLNDRHPFTWAGSPSWEDLEGYITACPRLTTELADLWFVAVIDPSWGRKEYLWQVLLEPLRDGYTVRPHPDLELGDQEC
jgi:hypothetical protein